MNHDNHSKWIGIVLSYYYYYALLSRFAKWKKISGVSVINKKIYGFSIVSLSLSIFLLPFHFGFLSSFAIAECCLPFSFRVVCMCLCNLTIQFMQSLEIVWAEYHWICARFFRSFWINLRRREKLIFGKWLLVWHWLTHRHSESYMNLLNEIKFTWTVEVCMESFHIHTNRTVNSFNNNNNNDNTTAAFGK